MPDKKFVSYIKEGIDKLKALIDKYNKLCPDEKDDINFLIKTYNRKYMNYNLYNNENIINYQTINNLLFNSYDGFNNELMQYFENNLIKKRYIFLYKEILVIKSPTKINKTEINFEQNNYDKITPLIQDDNNIAAYLYIKNSFSKIDIKIYNKAGNFLNNFELFNNYDVLPYNKDLIIFYNITNIILVYFIDNYKNYFFKNIHLGSDDNTLFFNINSINSKLIKTSSDNFLMLYSENVYSMPLLEHLQYDSNNKIITLVSKKLN